VTRSQLRAQILAKLSKPKASKSERKRERARATGARINI